MLAQSDPVMSVGTTSNLGPCDFCLSDAHTSSHCPITQNYSDGQEEEVYAFSTYRKPTPASFSQTYNPELRNHPNFSWRQGQSSIPPRPQQIGGPPGFQQQYRQNRGQQYQPYQQYPQYNQQVPHNFSPQVGQNQFVPPQQFPPQMNQQMVQSNPYVGSPQLSASRELAAQPQYVTQQPSQKPAIEDLLVQFMTRQEQSTLAQSQAI